LSLPALHTNMDVFLPSIEKTSWGLYSAENDYEFDREQGALVFNMTHSVSFGYIFLKSIMYAFAFVIWIIGVYLTRKFYGPFFIKYGHYQVE